MAKSRVEDVHVDSTRGHATIRITVSGISHDLWTNKRSDAISLDSFFQPGEKGWVSADPNTGLIDGYGK